MWFGFRDVFDARCLCCGQLSMKRREKERETNEQGACFFLTSFFFRLLGVVGVSMSKRRVPA